MKKLFVLLFSAIALFTVTSCNKVESGGNGSGNASYGDNTMTSLVGTNWSCVRGTHAGQPEGIGIRFSQTTCYVYEFEYENGQYVEEGSTFPYTYSAPQGSITIENGYTFTFYVNENTMTLVDMEGDTNILTLQTK